MIKKTLSDYTREEFTQFVTDIVNCAFETEKENDDAVEAFIRMTEYPYASDLIFYPEEGKESVDSIVQEITDWRSHHHKPLFRA